LTVRAAVPDDVNVTVLAAVPFIVTFPKLIELVLTVRLGVAAAVPVPLRRIMSVLPPGSLLEIVMAPVATPVTGGPKLTRNVID